MALVGKKTFIVNWLCIATLLYLFDKDYIPLWSMVLGIIYCANQIVIRYTEAEKRRDGFILGMPK